MLVSEHRPGATSRLGGVVSAATVAAWSDARTIEGPFPYGTRAFLWATPDGAERIRGGTLSAGVLPTLRVQPFLGRFFRESEEVAGRDDVVILSHALWMERFGGRTGHWHPDTSRRPQLRDRRRGAAGASNMAPFGDGIALAAFELPEGGGKAQAEHHVVTPGFAEALRLRLAAGRMFTNADPVRGAPVLVNEAFVRRYQQDGRPVVGRAFPVTLREADAPASTIAGVLRDLRPNGPRSEPRPEIHQLLRLVVRQGLAAAGAGLAIGTALSLGAAWLMRSLLFGVAPTDAPSYLGAAAALLAVALAACLVPARRAAASDPSVALTQD